ncbi:MAG: PAAR domain protein [Candidatus Ozemobacter sibiricus]|uniref:PAAR domain protein n=1 Tax=Candidatus Ozemobacter sibiricus TaxID=2268124 RepID=A0A367ZM72_9BACT|nr:MAG: PAAR domain protein [Candidatus Ozemobacter sibiricus]
MTPIVTGSLDTATEGLPNARIGDITACGAIIVTGSLNTND